MPRGVLSACHWGCPLKTCTPKYPSPCFLYVVHIPNAFTSPSIKGDSEITLFSRLLSGHAFPIRTVKESFALGNWYPTMRPKGLSSWLFARPRLLRKSKSKQSQRMLKRQDTINSNLHLCMHSRFRAWIKTTVASVCPLHGFLFQATGFPCFHWLCSSQMHVSNEKKPKIS